MDGKAPKTSWMGSQVVEVKKLNPCRSNIGKLYQASDNKMAKRIANTESAATKVAA
jgi:hypothetical protein